MSYPTIGSVAQVIAGRASRRFGQPVGPPPLPEALRHLGLATMDNECSTCWSLPPVIAGLPTSAALYIPRPLGFGIGSLISGIRLAPFPIIDLRPLGREIHSATFATECSRSYRPTWIAHTFRHTHHSWSFADWPCGSHRQSDRCSRSDQICVCRTSALVNSIQLAPDFLRWPQLLRPVIPWCLSLLRSFRPATLPSTSRTFDLQRLSSFFPMASLAGRLRRKLHADTWSALALQSHQESSSAGLRRWMRSSDNRVDKIGCRLRFS